VLEIANVCAIIQTKQDDDDTDLEEINDDPSEHAGWSTWLSDIEEDDLDNKEKILHLAQARRDNITQARRVPHPKKRNPAETVIACTSLPNCCTDWKYGYHYAKDYNVTCLFCS
jgi:hypothetical protein